MEILGEGECIFDKGGSAIYDEYPEDCFKPTSVEDGMEFVKQKMIIDEMPTMDYKLLSDDERRKMGSFMTLVCHDTVNEWKKLHNV